MGDFLNAVGNCDNATLAQIFHEYVIENFKIAIVHVHTSLWGVCNHYNTIFVAFQSFLANVFLTQNGCERFREMRFAVCRKYSFVEILNLVVNKERQKSVAFMF